MNGPKVSRFRCLSKIRLYAGKPENPPVLASVWEAVTIREVRTISRKDQPHA